MQGSEEVEIDVLTLTSLPELPAEAGRSHHRHQTLFAASEKEGC